jgi:chloride channel protein, CIC family
MALLAVFVGLAGGFGAVGFRYLINFFQSIAYGSDGNLLNLVESIPWYLRVSVPALGGLVVGPLVYFWAREAKGHGVPEVMEAVALKSGLIRKRLVVIKSLASAICIGTGGSVGREGPIVQIGSAIGSTIGQVLKISADRMRTLVGSGAAAGIAATFNAPIAGSMFALEIILGDFGLATFSPIVISSVIATAVSRHFFRRCACIYRSGIRACQRLGIPGIRHTWSFLCFSSHYIYKNALPNGRYFRWAEISGIPEGSHRWFNPGCD